MIFSTNSNKPTPNFLGITKAVPIQTAVLFILLSALNLLLMASAGAADYKKIGMELDIMADIMQSALKNSDDCQDCRIRVESFYLANQGAVFHITRPGASRFLSLAVDRDDHSLHIPPVPPVPGAQGALNIDDIMITVDGALAEVEAELEHEIIIRDDEDDDFSFWSWNWSDSDSPETSDQREALRQLSRERRSLRREIRDLTREQRTLSEKDARDLEARQKDIQAKLDEVQEKYAALQKNRLEKIDAIRAERLDRIEERQEAARKKNEAVKALVTQTLCEYRTTLRNLPKDEQLSLVFKGMAEDNQVEVHVFDSAAMQNCEPGKIREKGLRYLL
ncbi:MAG: OmpH family outer membrane protein [Gammaproteobacteria bacterium]|nr:OmpH family outer membrane protein [Gammaproteobacteria bacterium]